MKIYHLTVFLNIIVCIKSNFTTTQDNLLMSSQYESHEEKNIINIISTTNSNIREESKKIALEPDKPTLDTKILSNNTSDSRLKEAIEIVKKLDLKYLIMLEKHIDDLLSNLTTTAETSITKTTTYSITLPSLTSTTTTITSTASEASTTTISKTQLKATPLQNSSNNILIICITVFSATILILIAIIIYMVIINDIKIVVCGITIREKTKLKQIEV